MNDFPTYKGRWHRIPGRLYYLFIPLAAASWAFDYSKAFYTALYPDHTCHFIGRIYDIGIGYLLELHSGSWYIKIGSLK